MKTVVHVVGLIICIPLSLLTFVGILQSKYENVVIRELLSPSISTAVVKPYSSDIFEFIYKEYKELLPLNITNINDLHVLNVPLLRSNPNSIIFIKTHKTASSSMTNLLHNFCVKHNKSCAVLPRYIWPGREWHFDQKKWIMHSKRIRSWNKNKKYLDMWGNHMIFHPYIFKLIPYSNNQSFSILRQPNNRFISSWNFKNGNLNCKMNISSFILKSINSKKSPQCGSIGWNKMCKALIPEYIENHKDTYNVWKNIFNGNLLLLITEKWDQSLILLKNAYNMSYNDLLYTKMTKHVDKMSNTTNILTEKEIISMTKLNFCDWMLYNISMKLFNKRLYEIYKGNEGKLQSDINAMHKHQEIEKQKCLLINESNNNLLCQSYMFDNVEWNKWANKYLG